MNSKTLERWFDGHPVKSSAAIIKHGVRTNCGTRVVLNASINTSANVFCSFSTQEFNIASFANSHMQLLSDWRKSSPVSRCQAILPFQLLLTINRNIARKRIRNIF